MNVCLICLSRIFRDIGIFATVKQLPPSWYVGMANYCLQQNITTRGSALGGNVLPQAVIRHTNWVVIV